MINRIVKLSFSFEYVDGFLDHYKMIEDKIKSQEGCAAVQLLQDQNYKNVFFTYSQWKSVEHLNAYRKSNFFKATWSKIKPWFAAKPEAWSTKVINSNL